MRELGLNEEAIAALRRGDELSLIKHLSEVTANWDILLDVSIKKTLPHTCSFLIPKSNAHFKGDRGMTHLHQACFHGFESIVKDLVTFGCPINALSDFGETAISMALLTCSFPVIKFLLDSGADPNLKGLRRGSSAYETAISLARVDAIELLVSRGIEFENRKPISFYKTKYNKDNWEKILEALGSSLND